MVAEAVAAALLAAVGLWLVLQPLLRPRRSRSLPLEPIDPEETPKGIALAALKEIEFDRETGKLSDSDYAFLKAKYTAVALESFRQEESERMSDGVEALIAERLRALRFAAATTPANTPPQFPGSGQVCERCGFRPEPDAFFCSNCGTRLPAGARCNRCGATLPPGSRFCDACGQPVAA